MFLTEALKKHMFEIFKIKSITVSTVTLQTQKAILYYVVSFWFIMIVCLRRVN